MALGSLRETNGDQKKTIKELREQVTYLKSEVETSGDQQLFRKYKEVLQTKDELVNQLASRELSMQSNIESHYLIQNSYENLKQGQLELVEMNKKLIVNHQEEVGKLTQELHDAQEQIDNKNVKLARYAEIIKTFDAQIEMFEEFQSKSIMEMNKLQS